MMSVQSSLVMLPIAEFGSDTQKPKYLGPLARGEMIGCFGLTEPDHGSDPGSMSTRASKVEGGVRLVGAKTWLTNSPIADLFIVWAKAAMELYGFILGRSSSGLSTPTLHGKVGLRTSETGQIILDDVFVLDANLLPGASGLMAPSPVSTPRATASHGARSVPPRHAGISPGGTC
jgi:glutaryl-CoA dehydrogenase